MAGSQSSEFIHIGIQNLRENYFHIQFLRLPAIVCYLNIGLVPIAIGVQGIHELVGLLFHNHGPPGTAGQPGSWVDPGLERHPGGQIKGA